MISMNSQSFNNGNKLTHSANFLYSVAKFLWLV
uniref:Uncharacterized protein n=1 Tax=Zymomonas mobilis subsp. mobilis (strain ATCC 31821 / ZM4 / CP4) TaxID=264203 RepID=Q8GF36_ZYMMO|nr:unknown [Zymomonas mobilis subsp. mobilis ZM4 = ATCC 31821]